jgi:hypothetical protein
MLVMGPFISPGLASKVMSLRAEEGIILAISIDTALLIKGADFSVRLRRLRGGPEGIQRRGGSCAPIGQLPAKGPSFRAGELTQTRLLAAPETGIPSHLDVLEYQKKSRRIVVRQLLCGVGWRSAYLNSAPVHRGAEPAPGRCALNPQPKGRGASLALIATPCHHER